MPEKTPESKIIIDSDWKSQAQAEKDRLAAMERAKAEKAKAKSPAAPPIPGASPTSDDEHGEEGLPEANFKSLLGTLITNALMYMGAFPDPQTGRAMVAPDYAKFHIDLISVLQQKTAGNLTPEEAKDLDQTIKELQMQFVELMRAVTAMAMKQQAQGKGASGIGSVGTNPASTGDFNIDPATFSQKLRGQ